MTLLAAIAALISGGLAASILVGIAGHWIAPHLSLTPVWVSQSDLFVKVAGGVGGICALLILAGGYESRRLAVAIAAGMAIAIPLMMLVPARSPGETLQRPEWMLGLAVIFVIGLWVAFAEPPETGGTVGREEATLRAVFWLAFGGLLWFGWQAVPGLQVVLGQSVLSEMNFSESNRLRVPLRGVCGCGAAMLLCWLSWERYLLTAEMVKAPVQYLRNRIS